jgi:hypothetical protein
MEQALAKCLYICRAMTRARVVHKGGVNGMDQWEKARSRIPGLRCR